MYQSLNLIRVFFRRLPGSSVDKSSVKILCDPEDNLISPIGREQDKDPNYERDIATATPRLSGWGTRFIAFIYDLLIGITMSGCAMGGMAKYYRYSVIVLTTPPTRRYILFNTTMPRAGSIMGVDAGIVVKCNRSPPRRCARGGEPVAGGRVSTRGQVGPAGRV